MGNIRSQLSTLRMIISTDATRWASWGQLTGRKQVLSSQEHAQAAMKWMCRAQDAIRDGGVSYGFDVTQGWMPAYPETTGYMIPTFLNYADSCRSLSNDEDALDYRERARRMADWLMGVQLDCGAIPGGTMKTEPVPTVFNTGQVLQGWCAAYRAFNDDDVRRCLTRAAEWLVTAQDDDGCWRTYTSPLTLKTPATYNVRTASALFEASEILGDVRLRKAAIKNFEWALSQQQENGWFANDCLTDNNRPLSHTIGYTLEGFLDGAEALSHERYLEAVVRASGPLKRAVRTDGFLAGRFDARWEPQVHWNCLTGSSQIAGVWLRLASLSGDAEYRSLAERLMGFVKRSQRVAPVSSNGRLDGVTGGIKGSWPIWGGYDPFRYPNWSAKFFVDALLLSGHMG